MQRLPIIACVAAMLAGCQTIDRAPLNAARSTSTAASVATRLDAAGEFDNHEQFAAAAGVGGAPTAAPHVVVAIKATQNPDWTLWQIRLDGAPPLQATWAMQRRAEAWVPHRADGAVASASAFDPAHWTALEGCRLHDDGSARIATANAELCASFTATLGGAAALLPLAVERDGEWLHVRLFADQARGATAREDARGVVAFGGWAAINGAGPGAAADSKDWHMNNDVRIGDEGGRFAIAWRDGKPSGYSLLLERNTYRGNVPVLKLALIDDASARTLAYAWADPGARRIGLNLGWLQVGLERMPAEPATSGDKR